MTVEDVWKRSQRDMIAAMHDSISIFLDPAVYTPRAEPKRQKSDADYQAEAEREIDDFLGATS